MSYKRISRDTKWNGKVRIQQINFPIPGFDPLLLPFSEDLRPLVVGIFYYLNYLVWTSRPLGCR